MTLPLRPPPAPDGCAAPPADTVLANARLILPDRVAIGRIVLSGGLIAEIAEGAGVPHGAEDCGGDWIAPGLVELHTDNLERHIQPRPRVDWPHGPAILAHDAELAGAGITTVFDAMRVGSIVTGAKTRYARYARPLATELGALRAAGALRISHLFHLRAEICSETLLAELAEFGPEDGVGLLSLMDHLPGQRQFRDMAKYKAYIIGKHGLSEPDFAAHVGNLSGLHERLSGVHGAAAVAAAERLGAVLASHDDTTAAQVAASARHGVRLAEFPTTVEAAEACRAAGLAVMMGAPNLMRGTSHSGNVSALDLAADGLLDILSSDYVPAALLHAALRLAEVWDDLPRAVATVTDAPARVAGLTDRGRIAIGLRADVIRLHPVAGQVALRGTWSAGRRVA